MATVDEEWFNVLPQTQTESVQIIFTKNKSPLKEKKILYREELKNATMAAFNVVA
jgi:hypothetical protein